MAVEVSNGNGLDAVKVRMDKCWEVDSISCIVEGRSSDILLPPLPTPEALLGLGFLSITAPWAVCS